MKIIEKVGGANVTYLEKFNLDTDLYADKSSVILPTVVENVFENNSKFYNIQKSQGVLHKTALTIPNESIGYEELIFDPKMIIGEPTFYVVMPVASVDCYQSNNNASSRYGQQINAMVIHDLLYMGQGTDPYNPNPFKNISHPLAYVESYYGYCDAKNIITQPTQAGQYANSIEFIGLELVDENLQLPYFEVLDSCNETFNKTGTFAPNGGILIDQIGRDIPTNQFTPEVSQGYYKAQMFPSPDRSAEGYFRGEIIATLRVSGRAYTRIEENPGSTGAKCGIAEQTQIQDADIRVKITFEAQIKYKIKPIENLVVLTLDDKTINQTVKVGGPLPPYFDLANSFLSENYNSVLYPDGSYKIIYYAGERQSSVSGQDGSATRIVEYYVLKIFNSEQGLLNEIHLMSPAYKYGDIGYKVTASQSRFNNILSALNSKSWCYGVRVEDNTIIIPSFNLYLNDMDTDTFHIVAEDIITSNELYSYIDGIYCAIFDMENSKIYYVLRDGSGYYLINFNDFPTLTLVQSISIIPDDKIMLSGFNGGYDYSTYESLKFKLIRTPIKPTKIVYDFKKLNISFIPCLTHCMAKGGIISKV